MTTLRRGLFHTNEKKEKKIEDLMQAIVFIGFLDSI